MKYRKLNKGSQLLSGKNIEDRLAAPSQSQALCSQNGAT